jgi:hypothetical protein
MPKQNLAQHAFNRGTVSVLALARTDVDRLRLSAETQTNWMPRTLGPMMLRPGLGYKASTYNDAKARVLPFVFSASDYAALEFSAGALRVLVGDTPVTRPSVTTVMDDFTVPASWTLTASGGGISSIASDKLTLNLLSVGGTARATQFVVLGSSGVQHAIRIVVERGPVRFRVGTTTGGDDYITTTTLDTGTHSLAFTPIVGFFVQFEGLSRLNKIVSSCSLEAAGTMVLTTPYDESDLTLIRSDQSADVVYLACTGHQQRKIERRGTYSWSFVEYKTENGPFNFNADTSVSLTPASLRGNTTLTASRPTFRSTHVGALFELTHSSQVGFATLSASDTYTDTIRVNGVDAGRVFTVVITGTWTGTLTLQRSFDSETTGFTDVTTWTGNVTTSYDDTLDNSIVWYRIGFKPAAYGSGSATASLSFPGGSGTGVARVTAFNSTTSVDVEVLENFANSTVTFEWREGAWSDRRGWPSSVKLHEGRLWWAGNDRIWGSGSDDYTSFNDMEEGDAAPIDRSIGQGPIATINWLASTERLIAGADGSIIQAKSSSFDEPLTPTNFNIKQFSTQGSAALEAVKVDTRVMYVQASNRRIYQVVFDINIQSYKTADMTRLNEEIGLPGFVDIAVQRQPDTAIHFVRADGKVAVLLYDADDGVEAWWLVETDGVIEAAYVLPGTLEDNVYYVVRRTINGQTKRYHEKWARIDECEGGTLNKQADSFIVYSGVATSTIAGLDHLEGEQVVVWADGADLSPGRGASQTTYTVTGGSITLGTTVTNAVVGLPYTATFKSAKLAYAAAGGTALSQSKRLDHLGLILAKTHQDGLYYGAEADTIWPLPNVEGAEDVPDTRVWDHYDEGMVEMPGIWTTDARLHLFGYAPRPVTVMAAIISITTNG